MNRLLIILTVALQYARRSKAKLLFEIRLGFVARGADIGRFGLSQYPAEAECVESDSNPTLCTSS